MRKDSKPHKKFRLRKGLCTAFAAVALLPTGALAAQQKNTSQQSNSSGSEPTLVQAFGGTAKQVSPSIFPFTQNWNELVQTQQKYMQNAADARGYNSFLAQFNQYKGEPLVEMADNVNAKVLKEITYNEATYGNATGTYWAAPVQTEMHHAGDCKDFATLQYFIMRYLDVPVNRLFAVGVNSEDQGGGADHEILLLNTAPTGATPSFVVLNDSGPVVNANNYEHDNTLPKGWNDPYKFYDAMNQAGVWETSLDIQLYGTAKTYGTLGKPAQTAKLGMKIG